jgi:glutamate-1-semialdehyde 2,1-aminomutase
MSEASRANFTLEDELEAARARFTAANPKSLAQWHKAQGSMPGGNTRTVLFHPPFPLTIARGEGAHLWDADGHRYADFLNDFTAGLYGHSHPTIREALARALDAGVSFGGHTAMEEKLAALVCARFPSIELVRFTNSGTEASLMAVLAARAVTGRPRVLVFEGGYHGGVFYFGPDGSPLNMPVDWLMARYNDTAATGDLIEAHAGELAAILVEPMQGAGGCIPAASGFLEMLRAAADRHGIVLIFDEVMTSRLAPGGLQEKLGVLPDLTVLGKYLGGGLAFGAFGGRADIMGRFDPAAPGAFPHAGTFNNDALTMAAGAAGLEEVFTPETAVALNARGDALRDRLNALGRSAGVPIQVTGHGSIMNVHFRAGEVRRVDDTRAGDQTALALFHLEMLARGQYTSRRGFMSLSLPLGDEDIDGFVAATEDFLATYGDALRRRRAAASDSG